LKKEERKHLLERERCNVKTFGMRGFGKNVFDEEPTPHTICSLMKNSLALILALATLLVFASTTQALTRRGAVNSPAANEPVVQGNFSSN
jgi:hypothetical protein